MLGYLVRKRLVHQVRREYLGVVQELEGGSCVEVCWPRENTLCLPVFRGRDVGGHDGRQDQEGEDSSDSLLTKTRSRPLVEASQSLQMSTVPTGASPTAPRAGERTQVKLELRISEAASSLEEGALHSEPTHQLRTESSADQSQSDDPLWPCDFAAIPEGYHHLLESMSDPVPSELPREREGLLQLRARLSMELLWLKQAIASRLNVRHKLL